MSTWPTHAIATAAMLAACGVGGGAGPSDAATSTDTAPICSCDPAQACGVDSCGAACGPGCGAEGICIADACVPRATCDVLGFKALTQSAELSHRADGATFEFRADSRAVIPFERLVIQSFERHGGPTARGVYAIDDTDYKDCGLCVVGYQGCSPAGCARTFLADAGTFVIDRLAPGNFAATLRDASFREVYISDQTYASIPVPNGETWCVDTFAAHAPLVEHFETDTCVGAGTGREIGDKIADFTLTNCLGAPVALHDGCGTARAVWIVLATGWCAACAEHLPDVAKLQAAQRDLGLQVLVLLGEDADGAEPTLAYCAQYAADMGLDPAAVVIDWSQGQSFATIDDRLDLYSADTLSLPWDGVLDGSVMRYVWAGARDGGAATSVIDQLIGK